MSDTLLARPQDVVVIPHDPKTIARRCSRTVWIEVGHNMTSGEPSQIGQRYEAAIQGAVVAIIGRLPGLVDQAAA